MLNRAAESDGNDRPDYCSLIDRLAQESREWADAELVLARIELAGLRAQLVRKAVFAAVGVLAALCVFMALTQAGILLLAPLMGSAGLAALAVALAFALVAAVCVLAMRRVPQVPRESLVFRWFAPKRGEGEGS